MLLGWGSEWKGKVILLIVGAGLDWVDVEAKVERVSKRRVMGGEVIGVPAESRLWSLPLPLLDGAELEDLMGILPPKQ